MTGRPKMLRPSRPSSNSRETKSVQTAKGTNTHDGQAGIWESLSAFDALGFTEGWEPISVGSSLSILTPGLMSSYKVFLSGGMQEQTNTGRRSWHQDMSRQRLRLRTSSAQNTSPRDGSWMVQCQIPRPWTQKVTTMSRSVLCKRRPRLRDQLLSDRLHLNRRHHLHHDLHPTSASSMTLLHPHQ
jgi:hypothetical protein